ncbi:precorrin-6y C5,15-methyltransferase (decarboxylating) subunit CbiE [Eubacterium sp. 1001713B170207_170306_E7]|uniref:precorrin-6y C5,15-methyltransferase (decarboxylating) subunit CbiE n=1 Tax=Eubacterium sp. 1001713B170207_170306_E7 TaxID=2787097 RepID=UPI0018997B4C|nr:precorrin-6y C5,15-methyltransferase (decarboxylating) subunit CbiE [Eubacterium sp. 1001713B170207_170306_E7]
MYKLKVVSLGPGNPDYILPIAKKEIAAAEVILCGERHLESFDATGKEVMIIGRGTPLSELMQRVKEYYPVRKTAVVVSGDCGFYSLLTYTKKNVPPEDIEAIPGISSLQYLFAKIGMTWQDAEMMSLHGRDQDLLKRVATGNKVGILTDGEHNTAYIAKKLRENGYGEKFLYVGEDLSYSDERITRLTVEEGLGFKEKGMAVVVIADE